MIAPVLIPLNKRLIRTKRLDLVASTLHLGPPSGDGVVEIGCSVVPDARDQGYAREIVSALVAHAFESPRVREVIAHTSNDNVAATRLLLACGFERVGPGAEPGSIRFRTTRARYADAGMAHGA